MRVLLLALLGLCCSCFYSLDGSLVGKKRDRGPAVDSRADTSPVDHGPPPETAPPPPDAQPDAPPPGG